MNLFSINRLNDDDDDADYDGCEVKRGFGEGMTFYQEIKKLEIQSSNNTKENVQLQLEHVREREK